MSSSTKIEPPILTICRLLVFTFLLTTATSGASDNYTAFVFKGCSKQMFSNIYPENLKTLMDSLVSNSPLESFFAASTDGANAVNGLYQCRGDLSLAECHNCVGSIPPLLNQICGQTNVAQVQRQGCYMRYEAVSNSNQLNAMEFLFNRCGADKSRVVDQVEKRDVAFRQMIGGVKNSSGGLYGASSYKFVNVMGQCEGSLSNEKCVNCLQYALQKSKIDCGNSVSGQTYLYKCWIGYSSYSSNANGGDASVVTYSRKVSPGSGDQSAQKKAAIVIGVVTLVLVLVFMAFAEYRRRRK